MNGLGSDKKENGITLIEIIVIIAIIVIFLAIVMVDFPRIMRQSAISRATYTLSQNIRKTQDYGLSGKHFYNDAGQLIPAKGYGVYFDVSADNSSKYLIYADIGSNDINTGIATAEDENNQMYDGDFTEEYLCSTMSFGANDLKIDCILEIIDIKEENSSLSFKKIENPDKENKTINSLSINFMPPVPAIKITDEFEEENNKVKIFLKNTDNIERSVYVNESGLINVE